MSLPVPTSSRLPNARSNSVKLVTRVGFWTMVTVGVSSWYGTGPYLVSPAIPNVLVGTPSMERDRKLVSSK